MELQPHQQRVVDEKAELDKKATALSDFIGNSDIFPTLDAAEQERLKEQNDGLCGNGNYNERTDK